MQVFVSDFGVSIVEKTKKYIYISAIHDFLFNSSSSIENFLEWRSVYAGGSMVLCEKECCRYVDTIMTFSFQGSHKGLPVFINHN